MNSYVTIAIINIIALLFLSAIIRDNIILGKQRKKYFISAIGLTIIVILSETGTVLSLGGDVSWRFFHIACNIVGFSITPLIPIALIAIYDIQMLKKNLIILLPSALNAIMVALSPLLGLIFIVDDNNHYERGRFFIIFVIVYTLNLLVLVLITLRVSSKFLYPIKGKIIILLVFVMTGTFIQLLLPAVYSSWHTVTLSLFLYYIILTEFDSSFDGLTGLYNRMAFQKTAKHLKKQMVFSIVAMDINDFKPINDTFGHDYGDLALKKVAEIIRDSFDDSCSCYRVGGDEFYVLCRGTDRKKLAKQLRSMTTTLAQARLSDCKLPTIAYGISMHSGENALNLPDMLKEADEQMYHFKHLHKEKSRTT